ncbi:ATP-grasp domain-containing protein [Solihabitans fulvus]|uniref:ATP-grasp domain-containing protein n=1 Tax=Solihabitans fulvus TaxID=1892852 RepID=UPI001CB765B3|nr:ATP-grasp domain-containing protein [Solihabitans fulvus]
MSLDDPQQEQGERPLLLLIGSSARRNREFILRSVTRRYRLWLLQPTEVSWEEPYLTGFTMVDNTDQDKLVAAALEVAAAHPVAGVFCYDEGLVWPAAFAAEALGVPGNSPAAIAACRDKATTRAALAAAEVPQPESSAVASLAEARVTAQRIGYPVVLKPRGLAGSMGVRRANTPGELADAYAAASAASYPNVPVYRDGVLVEEYVDGPEISVDSVFYQGVCTPLVVARKQVGFEPFFEEVGHLVDAADPLLTDDRLTTLLDRSHRALGFLNGVTHTEFRLTERGPVLLEVNARLGGDLIPYLGWLAGGVDSAMAAADVAAGREPEVDRSRRAVAAVRFLYPERDTEVVSVTVREDRVVPPIHTAFPMAADGARLRLPPRGYIARYGCVIAVADSGHEAQAALVDAADIVRLDGRPLGTDGVHLGMDGVMDGAQLGMDGGIDRAQP